MDGWLDGWLEKPEIKPTQPSWNWGWAEFVNKSGSEIPFTTEVYGDILLATNKYNHVGSMIVAPHKLGTETAHPAEQGKACSWASSSVGQSLQLGKMHADSRQSRHDQVMTGLARQ